MHYAAFSLYFPRPDADGRAAAAVCLACPCPADCPCRQGRSCQSCRFWRRGRVTVAEGPGALAIAVETRPGLAIQVDVYREGAWEWQELRQVCEALRGLSSRGNISLSNVARDRVPGEV